MSDILYPTQSGRRPQQDLTPYSAVSSFNLPATYDSNLITPVSMSSSPSTTTKCAPAIRKDEVEIKLSPTIMSPGYHLFCGGDDEFASPRYNPPMKLKDPSGVLQISTVDHSFPASPYVCTSPYYGAFGVSATPHSARTSSSSPAMHASPHLLSAGGQSSTSSGSYYSRHETTPATSYRGSYQAPILLAPSPSGLRPATTGDHQPWRQTSLQSNSSTRSPPTSEGSPQGDFCVTQASKPQRGKKRKQPPNDYSEILRCGEINAHEKFILEMTLEHPSMPWKEIVDHFEKKFGERKSQACLQMRKHRCLDRLEKKSQKLAQEDSERKGDWSSGSKSTLKHAAREKWTHGAVQRRWSDVQSENLTFKSEYDTVPRRVSSDASVGGTSAGNTSSWSDDADSNATSLKEDFDSATLMSALSNASMEEVRTQALCDANARIHAEHRSMLYRQRRPNHEKQQNQQYQPHQQHQGGGWDSAA